MKYLLSIGLAIILAACSQKEYDVNQYKIPKPIISDGGKIVELPKDTVTVNYFVTEKLEKKPISSEFNATARIAAAVVHSHENKHRNLILFDNPELTANYTAFIQHKININQILNVKIKRKQIEVERYEDLSSHGAATGKDVLDAKSELSIEQTNLQNEQAAIIEDEAKLKLAGFDPEGLLNAKAGNVFIICDLPEAYIKKMHKGNSCNVYFSSMPDVKYDATIEDFGNVVDNLTRMVKMRIVLKNESNLLKAGMFAMVNFDITEGELIAISQESLITVQGKNYVFIKTGPAKFERREVLVGQQINNKVLVYKGVNIGDEVVKKGAMELKGLSFGY